VNVAQVAGFWLAIASGAALGGGCATQDAIEMDPMHFAVVESGGVLRVEALDAETLFQEGNRAFEAQDFDLAAAKYTLVIKRFPESRWDRVATFNGGLALEKGKRFAEAVPHFERMVSLVSGSKDAQDALFRLAACHEGLADWKSMRRVGDEILKPHYKDMAIGDRIAGLAVRGRAAEGLGELALAERDYRMALELFRDHLEERGLDKSPHVSLAQFRIGEIYRALFGSIRFKLPLDRMARDLEDKSNFFLMAQSAFLRALRLQHPDWAVVAGFRLGTLYETMYEDMLAAEVPTDLNEEEVAIYEEELRSKIRPLLVRAIDIYERNLRLGQRFGKRDDWMQKTEASLTRLQDLLREDARRAAGSEPQLPEAPK